MNRFLLLSSVLVLSTSNLAFGSNDETKESERRSEPVGEHTAPFKKGRTTAPEEDLFNQAEPEEVQVGDKRERPNFKDTTELVRSDDSLKRTKSASSDTLEEETSTRAVVDEKAIKYYVDKARAGDQVAFGKLVKIAKDKRHPAAQYEVGLIQFGKSEFASAKKWFLVAADMGHTQADVMAGKAALELKDYVDAFIYFQRAIKKHNAVDAHYCLGYMYHAGLGKPKDMDAAVSCYQKAANLGYTPAKHELAKIKLHPNCKLHINLEGLSLLEEMAKDYQSKTDTNGQFKKQAREQIDKERLRIGLRFLEAGDIGEASKLISKASGAYPPARVHFAKLVLDHQPTKENLHKAEVFLKFTGAKTAEIQSLMARISDLRKVDQYKEKYASAKAPQDIFKLREEALQLLYGLQNNPQKTELRELIPTMTFGLAQAYMKADQPDWKKALEALNVSVKENHPEAKQAVPFVQYKVAEADLEEKPKDKRNLERVIEQLNESATAGCDEAAELLPQAHYRLGRVLWACPAAVCERREAAVEHMSIAAQNLGGAKSTRDKYMLKLAHLYLKGEGGCPQNIEKSVNYCERGVKNGVAAAKHLLTQAKTALAQKFLKQGNDQLNIKAVEMLQAAAKDQYSEAQFILGRLLYHSVTVRRKDWTQSIMWLKAAAEQGHQQAKELLPEVQFEHARALLGNPTKRNMTLANPDFVTAIKLLEAAQDAGHGAAKDLLPSVYYAFANYMYSGAKEQRNFTEAIDMYRQAAALGHAKAQFKLGKIYLNGECDVDTVAAVNKNPKTALYWLNLACENGLEKAIKLKEEAMYDLAVYYSRKNKLDKSNELLSKLTESHNQQMVRNAQDLFAKNQSRSDQAMLEDLFKQDPLKCLNMAMQTQGAAADDFIRRTVTYKKQNRGGVVLMVDSCLDDLNLDSDYDSLSRYMKGVQECLNIAKYAPVLNDCMNVFSVPQGQGREEENVLVTCFKGKNYVTMGAQNISKVNALFKHMKVESTLVLPGDFSSLLCNFLHAKTLSKYTTDPDVLSKLQAKMNMRLPSIQSLADAVFMLNALKKGYLEAAKMLMAQKATLDLLPDSLAEHKANLLQLYTQSELDLKAGELWAEKSATAFSKIGAELDELIENSENRNRICERDQAYAPIMRAYNNDWQPE